MTSLVVKGLLASASMAGILISIFIYTNQMTFKQIPVDLG